jgi:hypothetical protein
MSGPTNFLNTIIAFLRSLFGGKPPQPPPPPPRDDADPPALVTTRRVLLVAYNPLIDPGTGKKLFEIMGWRTPESLFAGFMADITETSAGLAGFQVVERAEINDILPFKDGYRYEPPALLDVLQGRAAPHRAEQVDYAVLLSRLDALRRVAAGDFDEVWVFGYPHAGFYESIMAGAGAFFCNASPLGGTQTCPRRFIVMGFSVERGVGEMLESFSHRCESILRQEYAGQPADANYFARFTRYDKTAPGLAEVGSVHFAPNSERDYDWGNPRVVSSRCDDWYSFPNLTGHSRQVNCDEWGSGDIRQHHAWWLRHFPHAAGQLNGIANNWWRYVMDPNQVGRRA